MERKKSIRKETLQVFDKFLYILGFSYDEHMDLFESFLTMPFKI